MIVVRLARRAWLFAFRERLFADSPRKLPHHYGHELFRRLERRCGPSREELLIVKEGRDMRQAL